MKWNRPSGHTVLYSTSVCVTRLTLMSNVHLNGDSCLPILFHNAYYLSYLFRPTVSLLCITSVYSTFLLKPCCDLVFTGWTASVVMSPRFSAGYSYRCNHDDECLFHKESQSCSRHIKCRVMCEPLSFPNGQSNCNSMFEGQVCSVSCNRLFILHGRSHISCTSNGWSSYPYCIGGYRQRSLVQIFNR